MANRDAPMGFLPYLSPVGVGNAPIGYYDLADANSEIHPGDPVTITSGQVDKAAAGNALCGIAAEYKAANAGASNGKIAVYDHLDQRFVAQTDNGTGTLTAEAGIGLNANFVAGVGSNGHSTAEIDESTGATTATLPFKVLALQPAQDNAYGEFNRLIVKINNHQFGSHTGTAGS